MASPAVVGTPAETNITTASTTHVVNLPSGAVGNQFVAVMSKGTPASTATVNALTGWTEMLDEAVSLGLFAAVRVCDGTEGATTTFTLSVAVRGAWIVYEVSGAEDPATILPQIGTTATGSSVSPDPPSVSVTGGSKDVLAIAAFGRAGEEADDDTWVTAAPTSHTNLIQRACGTAGTNLAGMVATAERQVTTATVDPAVFTCATGAWRAQTIVIHPASLSAVGKDLILKYAIQVLAGKDLILKWALQVLAGKDLILKWAIIAQVGKDLILKSQVQVLAGKDLILKSQVQVLAGNSVAYVWNVIAEVGKSLTLRNAMDGAVGASLTLRSQILELAGKSLTLLSQVRVFAGNSVAYVWNVIAEVGSSLQLLYGVRELAGKDLTLRAAVQQLAGKSVTFVAQILSDAIAVGQDLQLRYGVQVLAGKSLSLVSHVRNLAGRAITFVYGLGVVPSFPGRSSGGDSDAGASGGSRSPGATGGDRDAGASGRDR